MSGLSKRQKAALVVPLLLFLPLFYFLLVAQSTGGENSSSYGAPAHLADLENKTVTESSGITASRRNANLFWTHNDSGDGPLVYAFDRQGKHRGVWRVAAAEAQDWEDMAAGPGPERGRAYLYIGDIGDNSKKRDHIIVYRVAEPSIASTDSASTNRNPRSTTNADAIRLKYPDGKHDAETLLAHPLTGDLYIVTKERGAAAGVYKLKAPFPKSGVSTLIRVGEVRFPNSFMGFITGGDISPDGSRVILCDYFGACELALPTGQGVTFDDIWKQPAASVSIGARRQGEAICYRADGQALLVTSEGAPCPLIETARTTGKR